MYSHYVFISYWYLCNITCLQKEKKQKMFMEKKTYAYAHTSDNSIRLVIFEDMNITYHTHLDFGVLLRWPLGHLTWNQSNQS